MFFVKGSPKIRYKYFARGNYPLIFIQAYTLIFDHHKLYNTVESLYVEPLYLEITLCRTKYLVS